MSVHTQGKMFKTRQTRDGGHGLYQYIYHVEENKVIFKTCQEYYWYMVREWAEHGQSPELQERHSIHVIFSAHDRNILKRMCYGASFGVCDDTIHVDNWAVSEEFLFHKHPEFGKVPDFMSLDEGTELEFSVKDGKCDLCHTVAPGEIQFLHNMYQL